MPKKYLFFLLILFPAAIFLLYYYGRSVWVPKYRALAGQRTVADVISIYGEQAVARLAPYFKNAGVIYPPKQVVMLATKDDKELELWASDGADFKYIRTYDIKKTSGKLGPKLREGDHQVPEGIYRIIGLNPNSSYHLSLKLNYPNDFDLLQAKKDGRTNPGSDIFIHGKALSVGCLAMGDNAIEELFVLVENVGKQNVKVVIAPFDPRKQDLVVPEGSNPIWLGELYNQIEEEFIKFN